jgi:type IV secretion system protein VirB9
MRILIAFVTAAALVAQQSAPVKATRKPAHMKAVNALAAVPSPASAPPNLADIGSLVASVGSIILSPTAMEALRVSGEWENTKTTPAMDRAGRLVYRFGSGLATIVCAPLRICTLELEPGEKVHGDPQIGDSVRWNLALVHVGSGDNQTSIIALKPQENGLDTTLLITTDRRAYYLRLISEPDQYVARVAFSYPEAEMEKFRQQETAHTPPEKVSAPAEAPAIAGDVSKMHFNYRISGHDEFITPVRVFDDGSKTYLVMSHDMTNREAPVLLIIGPDKKTEMTNYRVQHEMYIVDRLFEHGRLVLGVGKHAQKVDIRHEKNNG